MRQILIINGSGGVGKDTFVKQLATFVNVQHDSIVNPVKEIASLVGWQGDKTETSRKFLADLKMLVDNYNDYNYASMASKMKRFLESGIDEKDGICPVKKSSLPLEIFCIDMREKNQIERAKLEFGAKTVLVTRASVDQITTNHADAGVYDIHYDYHISNDGDLNDLRESAARFLITLSKELQANGHKKRDTAKKVIYISHPYGGDFMNLLKIQNIAINLTRGYPNCIFISPVHAFGYKYSIIPYADGLDECLWLLDKCDEMWVFGDYKESKGCLKEISYCEEHKKPYIIKGDKTNERN